MMVQDRESIEWPTFHWHASEEGALETNAMT